MKLRGAITLTGLAVAGHLTAQPPSFETAGVAFLEKHCISCHGPKKQKAGLTLERFRDESSVLRGRKEWRQILETLESGDMPPDDKPQPAQTERQALADSVREVFARADAAPVDPGRLILRRLNRTEYNNTVRDLLQVNFTPADDFPNDEVGYGFDSIGAVLTVSPLLMERYLDAAELIAAQAAPLENPLPVTRHMAARYCEPASSQVQVQLSGEFRPFKADAANGVLSGPINTPAKIAGDGDYRVRARLYAQAPAGVTVSVALLALGSQLAEPATEEQRAQLDGQRLPPCVILGVYEITAREAAQAQVIEARLPQMAGVERIAIAALKPPTGQAPPTIFLEWLESLGPHDTRSAASRALLVYSPEKPQSEQTREVLARFVPRAWRRPVQEEELARLCALVSAAVTSGERWETGIQRAVAAVLASPKFVFRLEPATLPGPGPQPVEEFALATRLSYFLWSSCPDEDLYRLAAAGQLSKNLESSVARMLRDPRATALVDNFAVQWLQLGRIVHHSADSTVFARWQPALRASMFEETRRFCGEIFREDRSILQLIEADFTWVDKPLANFYGIKPAGRFQPGEWKRVSLEGTPRGGLLTQASILTVTSNPTRTSPVKRGKWILEQLFGTPPPPAPAAVPSIDDTNRGELTGTFRQKLERHRADANCASCHVKMDAMGFALENFNAIGEWRELDETGAKVDASGELTGGKRVDGISGLKALLAIRKEDFARCFAEKLLIYALGRGLDYYDERPLDAIQAKLRAHDYRISALLLAIVQSEPFRQRRGTSTLTQP